MIHTHQSMRAFCAKKTVTVQSLDALIFYVSLSSFRFS